MPTHGHNRPFLSRFNTLMVKAVAMTALLTVAVLSAMVAYDYSAQRDLLHNEMAARAENVTELLAMLMGGSI